MTKNFTTDDLFAVFQMGFQSGAATASYRAGATADDAKALARHLTKVLVLDLADPARYSQWVEALTRSLAGEPPADEVRTVRTVSA